MELCYRAKKLGFDNIYSYQRLENKKCNPTLKVINGIKKLFPDFSLDYALAARFPFLGIPQQ